MNLEDFDYLPLHGGFLLIGITIQEEPMFDAMGRPALARTTIVGGNLEIELAASAPDAEQLSISIYHEVLEGATMAEVDPPAAVCELNQAAALRSHERFGEASPANLNRMLEEFGF